MRTTHVAALSAAGVALLGSISISLAAPAPRPTATPTPAAARAATPAPVASPTPIANLPTAPPWKMPTGPSPVPTELSLSQAEAIALASSPELASGRAVVDQNNAGIGIARSGELPDLSANASYARS